MTSPAPKQRKGPQMMISQHGGAVDISLLDSFSGDPKTLADQIHSSWGDPEQSPMLGQIEHIRLDARPLPEAMREPLRAAIEARFSRPVVIRK